MRITLAFCWAVPFFSLANAAAAGHRNGHYALRKGQWRGQRNDNSTDTVGAENFEGLRISTVTATETVTQQVQVTVAGEPVTVTQEAAKPSAVTVTETVMLNGKGATTTVTETVAGTCEGPVSLSKSSSTDPIRHLHPLGQQYYARRCCERRQWEGCWCFPHSHCCK
ncbi:hypothetical protein BGZ63DRAFT_56608 [Mariannaea sp. PMI_226]|nr:hypothetical protein BGZ63DRAFT_56608 [Mariannaea sp. PMI_226]